MMRRRNMGFTPLVKVSPKDYRIVIYRIVIIFKNYPLEVKSNISETEYHKNIKPVPLDKTCRKTN